MSNKELLEKIKELVEKNDETCPNCGHCPTCGRHAAPLPYYPVYPYAPQVWPYWSGIYSNGVRTGSYTVLGNIPGGTLTTTTNSDGWVTLEAALTANSA
jgi:hypothetical protein